MSKKLLLALGLIVLSGGIVVIAGNINKDKFDNKYIEYSTEEFRKPIKGEPLETLTEMSSSREFDTNSFITDEEFIVISELVEEYTTNYTRADCSYDVATGCYVISTNTEYVVVDLEMCEVYYTKLHQ